MIGQMTARIVPKEAIFFQISLPDPTLILKLVPTTYIISKPTTPTITISSIYWTGIYPNETSLLEVNKNPAYPATEALYFLPHPLDLDIKSPIITSAMATNPFLIKS